MGETLQAHRDDVVIATKFGYQSREMGYGPAAGAKGGRAYIRRAVEASLRRLRTDHIDLYQLHDPDPVTPIGETLAGQWVPTADELAAIDELVPPPEPTR